jgi:hypothetical protein
MFLTFRNYTINQKGVSLASIKDKMSKSGNISLLTYIFTKASLYIYFSEEKEQQLNWVLYVGGSPTYLIVKKIFKNLLIFNLHQNLNLCTIIFFIYLINKDYAGTKGLRRLDPTLGTSL